MAKILVVEDDADNRMLLEIRLQRMGHEVTTVSGAGEALALIGQHGPPDLAVVDIVMQGIDGLDLLAILRRVPDCVDLPVIMLTARTMVDDRRLTAELNAAFMQKPIVAADLHRAVHTALAA